MAWVRLNPQEHPREQDGTSRDWVVSGGVSRTSHNSTHGLFRPSRNSPSYCGQYRWRNKGFGSYDRPENVRDIRINTLFLIFLKCYLLFHFLTFFFFFFLQIHVHLFFLFFPFPFLCQTKHFLVLQVRKGKGLESYREESRTLRVARSVKCQRIGRSTNTWTSVECRTLGVTRRPEKWTTTLSVPFSFCFSTPPSLHYDMVQVSSGVLFYLTTGPCDSNELLHRSFIPLVIFWRKL